MQCLSTAGATEKPQLVSALNIFINFVNIEPGLLELFENVSGVRFFETQYIYMFVLGLLPFQCFIYCTHSVCRSYSMVLKQSLFQR